LIDSTLWLQAPPATVHAKAKLAAQTHQKELTKPSGALGSLEDIVIQLASLQGTEHPNADRISISVFAADHGVAQQGVSAFPQSVTQEMLKNFSRGGAAINIIAQELGANLEVINLGTVNDPGPLSNVLKADLGAGTADFTQEPAMTTWQLSRAVHTGRQSAERAKIKQTQLFIGGEMGIGNTTSASALACALLKAAPEQLVGPGTGLDESTLKHKTNIIRQGLLRHQANLNSPLQILRCLGGFEIAALTGSYMACAHMGQPVLIDGFISSVAALVAERLCPGAAHWFLFAHLSPEPGHHLVLNALSANPLLDLGLRLGEGSGAATAVPLLRLACKLHNQMTTFKEAGVSEKNL
jgi:nicotinate-nucleotide--dimethylbenzimidazole phosphoribosyltransferase